MRPIAATLLVGAALLAATGSDAGPAAAAAQTTCAHADDRATEVNVAALRKAILCLINEERRRHAQKPLRRSRQLQKAAARHTATMVKTGCLAHRCPGEVPLKRRIRRTGYFAGARDWQFAENTGCARSAATMVDNWMASTFHRVNILRSRFRDVGIGPSHKRVERRCKRDFSTFTVVFAFRTR